LTGSSSAIVQRAGICASMCICCGAQRERPLVVSASLNQYASMLVLWLWFATSHAWVQIAMAMHMCMLCGRGCAQQSDCSHCCGVRRVARAAHWPGHWPAAVLTTAAVQPEPVLSTVTTDHCTADVQPAAAERKVTETDQLGSEPVSLHPPTLHCIIVRYP
jgi:hypothetical protein